MKNAIILCSGGLDSVVCAHYVKRTLQNCSKFSKRSLKEQNLAVLAVANFAKRIIQTSLKKKLEYGKLKLIFFNYGQRALEPERECVRKCAESVGGEIVEIGLPELGALSGSLINKPGEISEIKKEDLKDTKEEGEKWYVPFRNGIFLSYALAVAEKDGGECDIFVGFQSEGSEAYRDTTPEFVDAINNLSGVACAKPFRVKAPLIKMDKNEIVSLGEKLGVDFKDTFSCYVSKNGLHCGKCLNCALRKEGFRWANVEDPTEYSNV